MIRPRAVFLINFVLLSSSVAYAQTVDVIAQANSYTVKIITAVDYPFGSDKKGTSRGSGFLVDKERGWILTNAHVASKSPSTMRASFKDQPYAPGQTVSVDNHLDLAVIKIDPSKIPSRYHCERFLDFKYSIDLLAYVDSRRIEKCYIFPHILFISGYKICFHK